MRSVPRKRKHNEYVMQKTDICFADNTTMNAFPTVPELRMSNVWTRCQTCRKCNFNKQSNNDTESI